MKTLQNACGITYEPSEKKNCSYCCLRTNNKEASQNQLKSTWKTGTGGNLNETEFIGQMNPGFAYLILIDEFLFLEGEVKVNNTHNST